MPRSSDRSYYFVPGNDRDAIAEARETAADALILDLEDSVGPDAKEAARNVTTSALDDAADRDVTHVVRINGLETRWGIDDLRALVEADESPDAVMVPEVRSPSDVRAVADRIAESGRGTGVVPLIERPEAVFEVREIAAADPAVAALAFGHGDFEYHLGTLAQAAPTDLTVPRTRVSMAASAANVPAVDTPHVERDDLDGVRRAADEARRLGFDGKMTFLPEQIDAINDCFAPSPAEVEASRRIVQAYEDAGDDAGVVYVDGEFVDEPVAAAHRERIAAERTESEVDR